MGRSKYEGNLNRGRNGIEMSNMILIDGKKNDRKIDFWKKPSFWRRIAIIVLLLAFCMVHYVMKVKNVQVYHDVLSSSIDGKVVVPFDQITGFEIMVHNEETTNYLDSHELLLNVWIEDEEGRIIWNKQFEKVKLRYLFFQKVAENMQQPIEVESGGCYYIHCSAEGVDLSNVTFRLYGEQANFLGIYILFVVCSVLVLLLPLFARWIFPELKLESLGFGIMLGVGLLYYIVMPPICGPDELFHFAQAYAVSDTLLGTENADPNTIMVPEDLNNIRYVQIRQTLYSFYDHLWDREYNDELVEFQFRTVSREGYPPYTYFFSGIGIALARLLGLNPQWILLLGRFGNLLFASFVLALGIRLMPFGKLSYLLFSIIPMTSALVGTYSYDCFNLVLVALLFAVCMKFAYDDKDMNWKRLIILVGLSVLTIPVKAIYFPMTLFVLFIPIKKYGSRLKWAGASLTVMAGAGLALLWQRLGYVLQNQIANMGVIETIESAGGTGASEAAVIQETVSAHYTVWWALENILTTIKIYIRTIYEYIDSYFLTAFGSRHTDIFVPTIVIVAVVFLFFVVCGTERDIPQMKLWQKGISLLAGIGVLFLIMTVMFLLWIDFGSDVIDGVNGRYLLPWLVCLPLVLKNDTFELKKDITSQALTGMVFLNIVVMLFIFGDLLRW